MSQTVLFLCPHNAAKSVIAVAYFQRLADQHGLSLIADSAGTEPDQAVWPSVIELLHHDGFDVAVQKPRHVTEDDLVQAGRIISMGCDLPGAAAHAHKIERWDDLPLASQDLTGSRDAIKAKVENLVADLTATRSPPPP